MVALLGNAEALSPGRNEAVAVAQFFLPGPRQRKVAECAFAPSSAWPRSSLRPRRRTLVVRFGVDVPTGTSGCSCRSSSGWPTARRPLATGSLPTTITWCWSRAAAARRPRLHLRLEHLVRALRGPALRGGNHRLAFFASRPRRGGDPPFSSPATRDRAPAVLARPGGELALGHAVGLVPREPLRRAGPRSRCGRARAHRAPAGSPWPRARVSWRRSPPPRAPSRGSRWLPLVAWGSGRARQRRGAIVVWLCPHRRGLGPVVRRHARGSPRAPPRTPVRDPLAAVRFFLGLLGAPLASAPDLAMALGVLLLGAVLVLGVAGLRGHQALALPWCSLGAFGMMVAAATALGRVGFGVDYAAHLALHHERGARVDRGVAPGASLARGLRAARRPAPPWPCSRASVLGLRHQPAGARERQRRPFVSIGREGMSRARPAARADPAQRGPDALLFMRPGGRAEALRHPRRYWASARPARGPRSEPRATPAWGS